MPRGGWEVECGRRIIARTHADRIARTPSPMPSRASYFVALAVGATVLTMTYSGSMLSSSSALDVRHSIQVLDDVRSAAVPMLRTYMSSDAPLTHAGEAALDYVTSITGINTQRGADASPPPFPPPPAPLTTAEQQAKVAHLAPFAPSDYDGYFLYARPETLPSGDRRPARS